VLGFRALAPLLVDHKPRPRWRTRIVGQQALRRYRTTLFGRAPGFAPGPAPVGPWRAVTLERQRTVTVRRALVRPALVDGNGILRVHIALRALGEWRPATATLVVTGPAGVVTTPLAVTGEGESIVVAGTGTVPAVDAWWPHTHGEPVLHHVALALTAPDGEITIDGGRIGFRSIEAEPLANFALRVNGERLFCRGGALMPDRLLLDRPEDELRDLLGRIRDAGMNMVRLSGLTLYGDDLLYRLCDELGLLVWQDFAFANMDYPRDDAEFVLSVEAEAADFLEPAGRHASLAVLCGGSEVEQQAALMGVDPAAAPGELFDVVLPAAMAAADVEIPYLRSTPTGGALPIRAGTGIAHYFGVGAYRRPLEDARRAEVRFAAECLSFSNVPEEDALLDLGVGPDVSPCGPAWKHGVPRDNGSAWDFEDVRDHYLHELFSVDPVALRSDDPGRYLDLSRLVTGVVMAETFGEWRRAQSSCSGALVWWLNDVLPGAGWGIIDSRGRPKPAYWIARRTLQPVAVWLTDEGTNGLAVHVANDTTEAVDAVVDVRLLRDGEHLVAQAQRPVRLAEHTTTTEDVEAVLGRFVDAGYAYRFGPPQHDVVVVTLLAGDEVLSQAAHFPLGRRARADSLDRLGVVGVAQADGEGGYAIELRSRCVVEGVTASAPGYEADDGWLSLIPGFARIVRLRPSDTARGGWQGGSVRAMNRGSAVAIELARG